MNETFFQPIDSFHKDKLTLSEEIHTDNLLRRITGTLVQTILIKLLIKVSGFLPFLIASVASVPGFIIPFNKLAGSVKNIKKHSNKELLRFNFIIEK